MHIGAQKMKTFLVQAFGTVNKKWRCLEPKHGNRFCCRFLIEKGIAQNGRVITIQPSV